MDQKKVIIVTGANCGIGLEAAKGLSAMGHDVVVSVRDDAKGEATLAAIKAEVPTAEVSYIIMELTDPQSIRDFVTKFQATGKKLNILLNNAGLFKAYRSPERVIARDDQSLEVTMTANCMGPFLLTQLLLEDLKATATSDIPSRVVNVSSGITIRAKNPGPFDIEDIMLAKEGSYESGLQSYRNSKLALNLWSNELAEKLKDSHVVVNTVCPGFIPSTGLARDNTKNSMMATFAMKVMDSFVGRYLIGTQPQSVGKERLIRMCLADDTAVVTGKFYHHDEATEEAPEVRDTKNQERIWDLCVTYSKL